MATLVEKMEALWAANEDYGICHECGEDLMDCQCAVTVPATKGKG